MTTDSYDRWRAYFAGYNETKDGYDHATHTAKVRLRAQIVALISMDTEHFEQWAAECGWDES